MKSKVSRRDFLKGAAAGAVGMSAWKLLGGQFGGEQASSLLAGPGVAKASETTAFQFPGADHTYGSMLNPQLDFTADSGDYSALFSPLKIGGVTLKNRLVKSCAGSEMQHNSEWPDDTSLAYYGEFCRGGIGMVCFEASNVTPSDGTPGGAMGGAPAGEMPDMASFGVDMAMLDISTDDGIAAHKVIADYMHQYDVPILAQMLDMMMMNGGGGTFAEHSKLENSSNPGIMQTTEQVQQAQRHFIDAAVRYYKAGFDGVEINCSCNHYFSTFLSRYDNHERTDQYSGESVENRARIVTEIIEAIRKEVGHDFVIQVLYSAVEEKVEALGDNALCMTIEDGCEMAKLFEKAGASSLHIRSQAYGHHSGGFMPDICHYFEHGDTGYNSVIDYSKHFGGMVNGQYDGVGAFLEIAARVKSAVSIPVGTVGAMDPRVAPDLLNNAIRDGKIDFLLMTRPLMADMALAKKMEAGRRDEIAPCARCMTCFVAPFGLGMPMYCRVNPALTRAFTDDMPEGYDPAPTDNAKRVMVIGGGPGGMEAARIAAERGHQVTLYEQGAALGGRMRVTQQVKGPHERIDDHRAYLRRQLEITGVAVKLNQAVDLALVQAEAPDAVVVAVGGQIGALDAPVSGNVLTFDDIDAMLQTEDELSIGEHTVILGGQFQACEMAAHLARRGKQVTILNPGPEDELYMNAAVWPKLMGPAWLYGKGVKVYHGTTLQEITRSGVTFDTDYGTTLTLACDSVIQALPFETNRALFDSLVGVVEEVYAVGDCYSPNTIANATARANIIARRVGAGATEMAVALADNQYSATASGYGEVRVTITVEDRQIIDAIVDTSNETDGIGRHLGEQFAQEILAGSGVDAVSGATMTTNAVQSALEACMQMAGLQ